VEILKFAEPPKRSSRTSTQKRGGLMPLLAVVVSVAVVGGMSTTLAGTINLNSAGTVEFGQGVVRTAACDTSIRILPTSTFDTVAGTFSVSTIELRDIGTSGGTGTETETYGAGCLGKKLTLRAYNATGGELNMNTNSAKSISVTIPESGTAAAGAPVGDANDATKYTISSTAQVLVASTFGGTTNTNGDSVAGKFTIGNLKIDGSVVRITLESSDA